MVGIETDGSAKAKSDSKKSDNGAEDDQFAMDGGTGGEEIPVTDEDMDLLVDQTRDDFIDLGSQIEQLKPELELTKKAVAKQQKILAVTPTIWPTDSRRITSTFGVRKDPFTRRATYHAGLDIGAIRAIRSMRLPTVPL